MSVLFDLREANFHEISRTSEARIPTLDSGMDRDRGLKMGLTAARTNDRKLTMIRTSLLGTSTIIRAEIVGRLQPSYSRC